MEPEWVTLRDYIDTLWKSQEKALTLAREEVALRIESQSEAVRLAREELNIWKQSHNDWQKQVRDKDISLISRAEFVATLAELRAKIEACERLVYIGLGIGITVNIAIGLAITFLKH